jgi:ribosomal protein S18 acetylase RimI-like enzyme
MKCHNGIYPKKYVGFGISVKQYAFVRRGIAAQPTMRYVNVMNFWLRAYTKQDLPFLQALYATTREAELLHTNFSDREKEKFCQQQFHAQHQTYITRYPTARFDLILLGEKPAGQPIGRLYVDRREKEIRVMDIALLPEWQNVGIGSTLMRQLQDEARSSKRTVSLHVEVNNTRAMSWYQRLGFAARGQNETHVFLLWPGDAPIPRI